MIRCRPQTRSVRYRFSALPTPFDEGGRIDEPALEHIARISPMNARSALLTEAGEDALLSPDERRRIVVAVSRRARGRVACTSCSRRPDAEAIELSRGRGPGRLGGSVGAVPVLAIASSIVISKRSRAVSLPIHFVVRRENAADRLSEEEVALFFASRLGCVDAGHAACGYVRVRALLAEDRSRRAVR